MAPLTEITLELLEGSDDQKCRIIPLKDNETVVIQRSSEDTSKNLPSSCSNLNLNNSAVSRVHASLSCKPKHPLAAISTASRTHHTVYVTDEKSRHGTYVNNTRLKENVEQELFDGDIIKFGINIDRPQELSFKAPQYLVSIKHVSDTSGGARGVSYSVPDDLDSLADSDISYACSDASSVKNAAGTIIDQSSDFIDLTQNEAPDAESALVDDVIDHQSLIEDTDEEINMELEQKIDEELFAMADSDASDIYSDISITRSQAISNVNSQHTHNVVVVEDSWLHPIVHTQPHSAAPLHITDQHSPNGNNHHQSSVHSCGQPLELYHAPASLSHVTMTDSSTKKRKHDEIDYEEEKDEIQDLESSSVAASDGPVTPIDEQMQAAQLKEPFIEMESVEAIETVATRPAKRSRLGMAALSIGMFLAGSTTTFAALAYLPDIA